MAFLGCLQILNIISVYVQHSYKLETFPQLFLWDSSIEIELLDRKEVHLKAIDYKCPPGKYKNISMANLFQQTDNFIFANLIEEKMILLC